ncbi:unnamed protein product [Mytilus coruscus]|uniref:Uncharacterized protein n=1 Tax=Mytilus coruscus TaxID=42192 RepID=A0A6J8C6Z6_MYTCO|nr:unnamed protein product [Mytilus coruscus]
MAKAELKPKVVRGKKADYRSINWIDHEPHRREPQRRTFPCFLLRLPTRVYRGWNGLKSARPKRSPEKVRLSFRFRHSQPLTWISREVRSKSSCVSRMPTEPRSSKTPTWVSSTLGRQLYPARSRVLVESYEDASSIPYGYLIVYMSPHSNDTYRLREKIRSSIENHKRTKRIPPRDMSRLLEHHQLFLHLLWLAKKDQPKALLTTIDKSQLKALSEIAPNVTKGTIVLTSAEKLRLKRFKNIISVLGRKSSRRKRKTPRFTKRSCWHRSSSEYRKDMEKMSLMPYEKY